MEPEGNGSAEPAYPASLTTGTAEAHGVTDHIVSHLALVQCEAEAAAYHEHSGEVKLQSAPLSDRSHSEHETQLTPSQHAEPVDGAMKHGDSLGTVCEPVNGACEPEGVLQETGGFCDELPATAKGKRRAKVDKDIEEDQEDGWDWHCSSCGCLQPPQTAVESCGDNVWSKQLLSCDGGCMKSFHIACLDIPTTERQLIIDSEEPWRCVTCMEGTHKCQICDSFDDPGHRPIMRWGDIESVSDIAVVGKRINELWAEKQAAGSSINDDGQVETAVSSASSSSHLKWLTCPDASMQRLRLYTFIRRAACVDDRFSQLAVLSSVLEEKRNIPPATNNMVHNVLARGLQLHANISYSIEHGLAEDVAAALRAYLGLFDTKSSETASYGHTGSIPGVERHLGSVPGLHHYTHEIESSYFPDATPVERIPQTIISLFYLAHMQESAPIPGTVSLLHEWFGEPEGRVRTSHAIITKLAEFFKETADDACDPPDITALLRRFQQYTAEYKDAPTPASGFEHLERIDPCVCCPLPLAGAPKYLLGAPWTGVRKCRHDKCGKYYHYSCLRRLADDAVADADVRRMINHNNSAVPAPLDGDTPSTDDVVGRGAVPLPVYVSVASAIESGYFDKWLEAADQFMKECLHYITSTWRNKPMPQPTVISTEISTLGVSLYGRIRKRIEALGAAQSDNPFQQHAATSHTTSKKKTKKKRNINIGADIPPILSPELIVVVLAGSDHPTVPSSVLQLLQAGDTPSLAEITQADDEDIEGRRDLPGIVTCMTGIECVWTAPAVSSDFLCPRHFCDACEHGEVGVAADLFSEPEASYGGPGNGGIDTSLWIENRRQREQKTLDGLHLPALYPLVLLDGSGAELGAAPPPCAAAEATGEEEGTQEPVSLKDLLDTVAPIARALINQQQGMDNTITIVAADRSKLVRRLLKKISHVKCCWLCPCAYHEKCLPDDAFYGDHSMLCHFHPQEVSRLVEKGEDGPLPLVKAPSFFSFQPTFTHTSIVGMKIAQLPVHPTAPQIWNEDDDRHFWYVCVYVSGWNVMGCLPYILCI
jgi:hypothetical protein